LFHVFSLVNNYFPLELLFEPDEELFELPPEVRGGLLPLPPPDLFPVVLGAFFNPLDFPIILKFY